MPRGRVSIKLVLVWFPSSPAGNGYSSLAARSVGCTALEWGWGRAPSSPLTIIFMLSIFLKLFFSDVSFECETGTSFRQGKG